MARILVASLLCLYSYNIFASSCCGQSPASFTILSLNQKLSLNTSYNLITSQGRIFQNSDEFFIWDTKKRQIQALNLEVASQFKQRHQLFIKSAILSGLYEDSAGRDSAQNLSDTLIGYSYEVLPEYTFSYWKPIIWASVLINAPTGKSIYDQSQLNEGADVTGHNQWGTGLGLTLKKVYFPFTLTFQARSLFVFSRKFYNNGTLDSSQNSSLSFHNSSSNNLSSTQVSNFFDNSLALLMNYSSKLWNLSFTTGVTLKQLSQRRIQPANISSGISESTTLLLGTQKVLTDSTALSLSYGDQTLIGRARNTILNRTYTLNFNYNYF